MADIRLIGIFGLLGDGKTAFATMLARLLARGFNCPIVSNYKFLDTPNTFQLEMSDLVGEEVIDCVVVPDDNLGMKTEVNDPLVMSVFEMLGDRAAEKGYVRTSAVYRNIVKAVKTNMVSFRRGGRKEMVDILTAQRQAELANPQIAEDNKLLGNKGGRR